MDQLERVHQAEHRIEELQTILTKAQDGLHNVESTVETTDELRSNPVVVRLVVLALVAFSIIGLFVALRRYQARREEAARVQSRDETHHQ